MFEYNFFHIARKMFGNRQLILVMEQNLNVANETSYTFHTIHMTVLLDFPSVLIIFVFRNSLIKTYFEAKVIRSLEN